MWWRLMRLPGLFPPIVLIGLTFVLQLSLINPSNETLLPAGYGLNPLQHWLGAFEAQLSPLFRYFLASGIIIITAFLIYRLFAVHKLVEGHTFLPALVYILFTGLISPEKHLLILLLGNLIAILCISLCFQFYTTKSVLSLIYDAGFLAGIASMLDWRFLWMFPAIYTGIQLFRTFNWREWLMPVIGGLTPWYLLFCALFITDQLSMVHPVKPSIAAFPSLITGSVPLPLVIIPLFIITGYLSGLPSVLGRISKSPVCIRKSGYLILWINAFSMFAFSLRGSSPLQNILFILPGMALYFPFALPEMKRIILVEIYLWILVIGAVYVNFLNLQL